MRRIVGYAACWLVGIFLWFVGCGMVYGRNLVEKMLTRLVQPSGFMLCVLLSVTVGCYLFQRRRTAWLMGAITALFWLTTNTLTANFVGGWLENRYQAVEPATMEPFDAVVVLGGGTSSGRDGHVWLNSSGDRVVLAVRLYHQGKVNHLITTGSVQSWSNRVMQLSEATRKIWVELGVPTEVITEISGMNTTQEMQALQKLFADDPGYERVGLVTSAFHMPRAERLARKFGLDLIPIPCSFQVPLTEPFPLAVLPSHEAIVIIGRSSKEILAAVVGR